MNRKLPILTGGLFDVMTAGHERVGFDNITPESIAHGLCYSCRWSNQTDQFYSVAQHCAEGARYIEVQYRDEHPYTEVISTALYFLLHDVEEAFLPDISYPIRCNFSVEHPHFGSLSYDEFSKYVREDIINVLCPNLNIPEWGKEVVERVDRGISFTEAKHLLANHEILEALEGSITGKELIPDLEIVPWPKHAAKNRWMFFYDKFTLGLGQ